MNPTMQRALELEEKVGEYETLDEDGWVGFTVLDSGNVLAGKNETGISLVREFEPVGFWAREAERLRDEQEFRYLVMTMPRPQFKEFVKLVHQRQKLQNKK